MVRDPRDRTLPDFNTQVILEDPFSNRQIVVRPGFVGHAYKNYVIKQEQIIRNAFLKADADFLGLITDKSFIEPITNLFTKRAKRIR
jgi:hypothetical protein